MSAPLPGPRRLRAVFQQWAMLRDPLAALWQLANDYGPVASFRVGTRQAVLLNDPALVQRLQQRSKVAILAKPAKGKPRSNARASTRSADR